MSKKNTFISISLPEILKEKLDDHLAESDFGNVSEYVRTLIRADLARFEYEKLVKRRLGRAGEGEVAISEEEATAYLAAKARGENPAFAPSFQQSELLEAERQLDDILSRVRPQKERPSALRTSSLAKSPT